MESHSLQNAQDFLDDQAAKLGPLGYQTRVTATLGTPVEAILQQAMVSNADVILVGSRGRRGMTRMVLGSVSHALLHQGTYPLMIFS
jgi:nucleotide-binding universal stress UspA family protein